MPLFDDLSKRISKAGQTAIQKTKDVTDIARINSAISEEEKAIDNLFFQIGKSYYSTHQDEVNSEFASMIASIKEKEAKIQDFKRQVQDIKGVVRCEKCGAEVPSGAAFCNSCGSPMPKPVPQNADPNLVQCPNCGKLIAKGMKFCTGCGTPIPQETAPILENIVSQDSAPPAEADPKICPNCGAVVPDDDGFCSECGSKVD